MMATWLGLRRRRQQAESSSTPSSQEQQEEHEEQQEQQEEEDASARQPTSPTTPTTTPSPSGGARRVFRTLKRWLMGALSVLGLLTLVLAVLVARSDMRAVVRSGRPPTWPTYRAGLRLLELVEYARDTLTPPDLRALELSYAFIDTAIVHQMTAVGALDAFPRGAGAEPVCLCAEEVALAAPTASHPPFLYRLLRAAATRGLVDWQPEPDDCFSLTALGARFQRRVRGCWR